MAKETAKKFLLEYAADPEAMKLLNEYPQPESPEDGAKILSEIAGKLGIAFTAEEMAEAIEEAEAARKARTDAAAEDLTVLPDDELGEVAGGGNKNSSCSEDYMRTNSCWSDFYCYGIYHGAPDDRRDVPCKFDYNCFNAYYAESCEQNYFYQRSICKSNQD